MHRPAAAPPRRAARRGERRRRCRRTPTTATRSPSRIGIRPSRTAARAAAPAGSRTCFIRSSANRTPARIVGVVEQDDARRGSAGTSRGSARPRTAPRARRRRCVGWIVTGSPASNATGHRGRVRRLDAVDADAGPLLLDRRRDAGDQAAAADADDHDVDVGQVVEDLEPDACRGRRSPPGRRTGGRRSARARRGSAPSAGKRRRRGRPRGRPRRRSPRQAVDLRRVGPGRP